MIGSCSALNSDQEYVCFKWFWAVEVPFLSIEISATCWQVLELNFIMIASCSALNFDQEYVCFKWFWAVEVPFSKYWNQRHLLTSFRTKFYYDRIVFSVKFWSRICLFQMVLSSRSAFFYQRHLVTSFRTKFYYDCIGFSVKFWSRICLF
jgi:hypothetical protein